MAQGRQEWGAYRDEREDPSSDVHGDRRYDGDAPPPDGSRLSSSADGRPTDDPAGTYRRSGSSADRGSRSRRKRKGRGRRDERDMRERRQPPFLARIVNGWWDRLLSATFGGTFDTQGQLYESGRTTRDYLLNTAGLAAWGTLFPVLTIVATQLAGADGAGAFSMAFTTATLLLYVGNYGVRTFQVSDVDETESFASYQIQRVITCVVMLIVGALYCVVRGYDAEMVLISAGAYGFRAVDALADVYEGRLQQEDKLYLAGISLAVRSLLGVVVFAILLFLTRSLVVASIAMAIAAVASFVLLTLPLTLLETVRSRSWALVEVREIFTECFPAASAMLLFALIEAVPKYAMEGVLSYDNQIYFNALYFPAQSVLMVVGFVYKPQLVRIAGLWSSGGRRGRFDLIVVAMLAVTAGVTALMLVVANLVLIPLSSLLYATDFERFRFLQQVMIIAGGLSAAIDFLYQILTVLRRQSVATRTYLIAFAVAIVASIILVRTLAFDGAVWAYAGVMALLLVALAAQYVRVRLSPADE